MARARIYILAMLSSTTLKAVTSSAGKKLWSRMEASVLGTSELMTNAVLGRETAQLVADDKEGCPSAVCF